MSTAFRMIRFVVTHAHFVRVEIVVVVVEIRENALNY